jgi:hypothetical protein
MMNLMNTAQTKTEAQAASIVLGSLIKIEGAKTPLVVTEVHDSCFVLAGSRGDFAITNCRTHWVRWPIDRYAQLREIRIEWVKAPADA